MPATQPTAEAVILVDARGLIVEANAGAADLFGFQELLGVPFASLVPAWPGRSAPSNRAFALAGRRQDGSVVHVDLTQLQAGGDGPLVCVLRDASARRALAEAVKRATDLEARTAEARRAFLATLSHELRTPLAAVLGFAELLVHSPLDAAQHDSVRAIRDCGEELRATIDELLDATALEMGAVEITERPFDLVVAVEETLASLRPRASAKSIELKATFAADAPRTVAADEARIRQVLTQLVRNAIKFTPAGRVHVEVACTATAARANLRIAVADTGVGVPQEARALLFQPFRQRDASSTRRHGGLGVGLGICRRLTELMGGAIGLESDGGAGATFWFMVPVTRLADDAVPAARPAVAPAPLPASAAAEVRVLVADDQPVNQTIARRILERLGCRVDIAADGRQAVEFAARARYDLVFMDCHMPVMDGFEATREIRRSEAAGDGARTPIVALTASSLDADRDHCYAAGMDGFLGKPVDVERLAGVLERFTRLRRPAPLATAAG